MHAAAMAPCCPAQAAMLALLLLASQGPGQQPGMGGVARLLLPPLLLSARGGASAFKLVIDGNTMAASDLRKVATGRLAANGSYSIFANWNATGTNERPSDELWRSYLKGLGTELAFTEEDGWAWESSAPAECVCRRLGAGGSVENECGCQTFRRLTGKPPTAALGYTESLIAGQTLMSDTEIDLQAKACGSPVVVMTRSFCVTPERMDKPKSGQRNSSAWIDSTTRALQHRSVYGVAMEYTPIPEPVPESAAWQGCGIVDLMHLALGMNKSVLLLWPVYGNDRGEPAWQNVADAITRFREAGAPIDSDRVVVVLAMYGRGARRAPWWTTASDNNTVEHAYKWLQAHRSPLKTDDKLGPAPPLPKPTGAALWTAGSGLLRVAAFPTATRSLLFRFEMNGSTWLSSADVMLRCSGTELRGRNDSLRPAAATIVKGDDPRLGAYEAIEQRWSAAAGAPASCTSVTAVASARYFPLREAFEFRLVLPTGSIGTATGQDPAKFLFETLTEHSTAFPQLALSPSVARLGFMSWSGNSLGSRMGPRDYNSTVVPHHAKDGYAMAEHAFPGGAGLSDYRGGLTAGPLVLYDVAPSAGLPPAVVIAVLADFKNVIVAQPEPTGQLIGGAQGFLDPLQQNFTTRICVLGRQGIQTAMHAWGEAAKAVAQTRKTGLANDTLSRKLHYLSDNGAVYAESVSCPSPYGAILAKLAAQKNLSALVGLWHLDPFWYSSCPGSPGCAAGTFGPACASPTNVFAANYTPSPWHFPSGRIPVGAAEHFQMFISALAPKAHNDYAHHYTIIDAAPWFQRLLSATGLTAGAVRAMPAAEAAEAFWTDVISHHYKANGLRAVVWDDTVSLSYIFQENINSTTKTTQMLAGLWRALETVGATARVDMQGPTDSMLGLRFSALTVGRAAGDGTPSSNDIVPQVDAKTGGQNGGWALMSANGLFFTSLDVRPMLDVLWTTPTQPYVGHVHGTTATRLNLEHGLAMTVLSTGPLGIGDAVGKTNTTFLRPALRSDGVILKPCRPALRLDRFYAGGAASRQQEVWAAVSAPARVPGGERDGRAESMARLGTSVAASGLWWLSIISTNLAVGTPPVRMDELWPTPPKGASFLVHRHGTACTNGSAASSCVALFDAAHPLAVSTGTPPSATDPVRRWSLQSAAPVLESGWAVLGDLSRIVPVSPQRFASARGADSATAPAQDDSLDPAELAAPERGLAFVVIGVEDEVVDVTLVRPSRTVLVVAVVVPAGGRVTVTCPTRGACAQG